MLYAAKENGSESTFMDAKLSAGIVDNDKSEISKYMIEYLSKLHNVEIMEDDTSVLQEKMYYNKEDIIIQIPKGFSDNFLTGGASVSVTQQPGQFSYMYIESQINDFINRMVKYNLAGYAMDECFQKVSDIKESKISLMDINGNGGQMPDFAYLFQYFPYISIAILGQVLGIIVYSFRKREVKNRIAASAVPLYRQSLEALLALIE